MRQSILDLCAILQDESAVISDLLELAKEEQEVIVAGESGKLEGIIKLQIKQLNKIGALEKKRTVINKAISSETGIPEKNMTIRAILETANPNEKVKLAAMQKQLIDMVEKHTKLSTENRELIKTHVEYTDTMLELVVGAEDPLNNIYGGDGKAASERKKSAGFYSGHA